jgi:hypothetical protein
LELAFSGVKITILRSESEFRTNFSAVLREGVSLFILDCLLRWASPETGNIGESPGPFQKAGIRCARLICEDPRSRDIPVIIYSVVDAANIRAYQLGENVLSLQKSSGDEALVRFIRSVLPLQAEPSRWDTTVFIVHGHDDVAKEETARVVRNHGLNAVILNEQAHRGKTVIELIESFGEVSFAIVLLTPDDAVLDAATERPKYRARQNVILELGYFLGRLGRDRICVLYKAGCEIPSDYQGVLLIEMDALGEWQRVLAKSMRAAGLPVD